MTEPPLARRAPPPGNGAGTARPKPELVRSDGGRRTLARPAVDPADLAMMAGVDRLHTDHPEFGSRKWSVLLSTRGRPVNRKRVQRLMRVMGLDAL